MLSFSDIPIPPVPPTNPVPPVTEGTTGLPPITIILIFLVMAGAIYMLMRSSRKKTQLNQKIYAEPLYTTEQGKVLIKEGWYPTPDGTQDRYHDGEEWTEEYRDHEPVVVEEVTDWDDRLTKAEAEAYKDSEPEESPLDSNETANLKEEK